eukprot:NODE_4913_length_1095_cov_42.782922_g4365_i0.p1 GENE.NODE_4913_length_1095_cov_42.782922_g4365_i0~~NODE_4913_length_1095_cov_42.782922_g4365_i0.p1  ORF type:complete len:288 (+),score=55.90 NODE_4913_length_1095_cov_42.782922_g4365_i0:123-986(+)
MEELGLRCFQEGDYQTALWFFQRKLLVDPENTEVMKLVETCKLHIDPSSVPLPLLQEYVMQRVLDSGNDVYLALGLESSCTNQQISKQFRQAALLLHPDKNNDPRATEAFALAKQAFEVLSNPDRRKLYDDEGVVGDPTIPQSPILSPDIHRSASKIFKKTAFQEADKDKSQANKASGDNRGIKYESPNTVRAQAEQWSRQAMQRTPGVLFRQQRDAEAARMSMYEPPKELVREWQRQQVIRDRRSQVLEFREMVRTATLEIQYQQLKDLLEKQRNQCKLSAHHIIK